MYSGVRPSYSDLESVAKRLIFLCLKCQVGKSFADSFRVKPTNFPSTQNIFLTLSWQTSYIYKSYHTANLQMLHFIYYSTNLCTEYFNMLHTLHFFSLQNAVYFIMLPFLVPALFTFYIQGVLKLKKKSGAKGLNIERQLHVSPARRNLHQAAHEQR